jgi:hypothetical protein
MLKPRTISGGLVSVDRMPVISYQLFIRIEFQTEIT